MSAGNLKVSVYMISRCCHGPVFVQNAGDGGSSYYVCDICHKACDPAIKERDNVNTEADIG